MHHRGAEGVDFTSVGLPLDKLPGCQVSLPDMKPVKEIARVLNQPWVEVVMDLQLFPASVLEIQE